MISFLGADGKDWRRGKFGEIVLDIGLIRDYSNNLIFEYFTSIRMLRINFDFLLINWVTVIGASVLSILVLLS